MGRWIASKRLDQSANGTSFFFLDNKSTETDMVVQFRRLTATTQSTFDVYRNPAVDTAGTEKEIFATDNQNDTSDFVFRHGGSYSSKGESLTEGIIPAGKETGQRTDPGLEDDVEVITVPAGESLLVQVDENSGNSGLVAYRGTLIEQ